MRGFFILTLVFLTLSSCRPTYQTVNLTRAPNKITYDEYPEILKKWTRNGKIIWKFDTTLNVYATMLSWEYRKAYSELFAHVYNLDKKSKNRFWNNQVKQLDSSVEFIVAAASANQEWIDFEKGSPNIKGPASLKGSIWKITLKVDNNPEIYPIQIKKLNKTKLHESMFPYMGHFYKLYIIKFPFKHNNVEVLPEYSRKIILKFRSPLGKTDLVWKTNNVYVTE